MKLVEFTWLIHEVRLFKVRLGLEPDSCSSFAVLYLYYKLVLCLSLVWPFDDLKVDGKCGCNCGMPFHCYWVRVLTKNGRLQGPSGQESTFQFCLPHYWFQYCKERLLLCSIYSTYKCCNFIKKLWIHKIKTTNWIGSAFKTKAINPLPNIASDVKL